MKKSVIQSKLMGIIEDCFSLKVEYNEKVYDFEFQKQFTNVFRLDVSEFFWNEEIEGEVSYKYNLITEEDLSDIESIFTEALNDEKSVIVFENEAAMRGFFEELSKDIYILGNPTNEVEGDIFGTFLKTPVEESSFEKDIKNFYSVTHPDEVLLNKGIKEGNRKAFNDAYLTQLFTSVITYIHSNFNLTVLHDYITVNALLDEEYSLYGIMQELDSEILQLSIDRVSYTVYIKEIGFLICETKSLTSIEEKQDNKLFINVATTDISNSLKAFFRGKINDELYFIVNQPTIHLSHCISLLRLDGIHEAQSLEMITQDTTTQLSKIFGGDIFSVADDFYKVLSENIGLFEEIESGYLAANLNLYNKECKVLFKYIQTEEEGLLENVSIFEN